MAKNKNNKKPKKNKKLVNINESNNKKIKLTSDEHSNPIFKVLFAGEAENGYDFKDCNPDQWHDIGNFLDRWVGKSLKDLQSSNSARYIDKKDKASDPYTNDIKQMIHYKVTPKSRIHGYYNNHGYFVIKRLDPDHKKHKC